MADLSITAADVAPLEIVEQFTAPAAAACTAGEYLKPDATSGKLEEGQANIAGNVGNGPGIALRSAGADEAVTIMRKGILSLGDALAGLSYDDPVYLSDTLGTLADSAGTVSTIVGYVVPVWDGTTPGKALKVEL